MFLANTFRIFSNVFHLFCPSFGYLYYRQYIKMHASKNRIQRANPALTPIRGRVYYSITWPPRRALRGIGPNEERGLT